MTLRMRTKHQMAHQPTDPAMAWFDSVELEQGTSRDRNEPPCRQDTSSMIKLFGFSFRSFSKPPFTARAPGLRTEGTHHTCHHITCQAHSRNACKTLEKRVVKLLLGVLVKFAEDGAWHTHDSDVAIKSILGEKQEMDVPGPDMSHWSMASCQVKTSRIQKYYMVLPPRILKLIMATFALVAPDILRFIGHVCVEVLP